MGRFNIFGFNVPSFEDEFVQSDSELALENAPASARRGGSRKVSHFEGEPAHIGNISGSLEEDMALNIGIFSNSTD
jgi:hypothetical protein